MSKATPRDPSANKQERLMRVPGGWKPKSKVHHIQPGYHISGEGRRLKKIHSETGKVIQEFGAIAHAPHGERYKRRSDLVLEPKKKDLIKPQNKKVIKPWTGHDWMVNSGWMNNTGNPISYFSTRWIVPPAPPSDNDQIIYMFNGIETRTFGWILQPVLQWGDNGDFGGDYWCIANWFVNSGSFAGHGNSIQVNAGDVLQGIMTLTNHSGGNFSYLSSFDGHSDADFTVTDFPDELTWANEALERYWSGLSDPTDYPDASLTAFHDVEIKLRTQETPVIIDSEATINWDEENRHTSNGEKCLVVSDDSPGGDVYLYYRNVPQNLYFVTDKSTFGKDEVTDVINGAGGLFPNAFWVVLEGFTIDQLTIDQPGPLTPALSGAFKSVNGVTLIPKSPDYELPGDLYTPQRIMFPFDIQFTSGALTSFPGAGDAPVEKTLNAGITIGAVTLNAVTLFELTTGADPYFTNVDPAQDNFFWLSADLRVFNAAPAINNTPVPGGPAFNTDSVAGAYGYIQSLLGHLNTNYKDPSGVDPFVSLLPGQAGALTGDSSVSPISVSIVPFIIAANYNFAIARVRLRGTAGPSGAAPNVKVFFRLWSTQSADTDYDPGSTYLSNLDANSLPASPLPAVDGHTIPFFATGNSPNFSDPNNSEYGASGVNNRPVQIDTGDSVWAYFGCFLNVYDTSNIVNGVPVQALLNGTHHCIVAQIAYDDAPIINANGVTMSPENSDKLAQRNLQITLSDNPGAVETHRIPQTFDLRPSMAVSQARGDLLDYPDELMIDWGNTPAGSIANIYWPQVDTTQVVRTASKMYGTHRLSAPDHTTIRCTVTDGVTYIPIPSGKDKGFAGLFTVDLPSNVVKGQEFDIIVRRIRTRRRPDDIVLRELREVVAVDVKPDRKVMRNWRYVVGTFQVKIPVSTKDAILFQEENTLAVLKWRLAAMSPSNRWHPVLKRHIEYVSARVNGLGGNADEIKPSLRGVPVKQITGEKHEFTGKISEVMYDCFGDFEGFVLSRCCVEGRVFRSRDAGIGHIALHACEQRLTVTVFVDTAGKTENICKIVVRGQTA
jgi:hypothetical protein